MSRKIKYLIGTVVLILFTGLVNLNAQDALGQFTNQGIIKVAEPGQLADTLNLWGDIRNPGRYMVPRGTSIPELISYARGPITSASGEREVKGIEVFILRYSATESRELANVFRFKPNEPLPQELRTYDLQNNDTITIKVQRKRTIIQGLRNVTPFITLILSGVLAYDRLSGN